MGIADKAQNSKDNLAGKAKEAVGNVSGDNDMENEGKADQFQAAVNDAGEKTKDAASNIKDKLT